jgi:hypothetical protein
MKRKKININDDERWERYNELKKQGEKLKADKLKEEILDSYKWKKPCHHM